MEIRVSEMEGSKNSLRVVSFVVFFFSPSFFLCSLRLKNSPDATGRATLASAN
jgi:hypothetical protein